MSCVAKTTIRFFENGVEGPSCNGAPLSVDIDLSLHLSNPTTHHAQNYPGCVSENRIITISAFGSSAVESPFKESFSFSQHRHIVPFHESSNTLAEIFLVGGLRSRKIEFIERCVSGSYQIGRLSGSLIFNNVTDVLELVLKKDDLTCTIPLK